MRLILDRYQLLGLSLIGFGVVLAPYSLIVLLNVALTSLGIGVVILGATLLVVPGSPVPVHHIKAMMEGSLVNIEAILEEFNVSGKAVYVPGNDRVYAFIPFEDVKVPYVNLNSTHLRILAEVGGLKGVFIFPPGSEALRLSSLPGEAGLEDAVSHVLVDFLESVDSIKVVRNNNRVTVEILKPKVFSDYPRANSCLGSYTVSIAGCIISSNLDSSIQFLGEEEEGGRKLAFFEVNSIG